ncbi:NAD(P)-dependent oxidoreductase [Rhodococcus sp. HNM0569]|uniref:NAD-dependent epimerase/dehydratase family protein n=1 Tax=Rhodococcus sp. HNM0569 TaxID=2716340 RepID=UPI00146E87FC|nr:NAD(P)-dependent oxidoreductase [Rhodococcus sp. HNM0569]NLU82239.1 NAD(P)-dependent oxidoreductase [Rhodococcus sp. HNM0569]
MRIFVTGGTGAIGNYAVPALIAAGHDVDALARRDDKARLLASYGANPVRVSLFDRDELTQAFRRCDAVVNLATALPSTLSFVRTSAWERCQRIRTEGSAAVTDSAQRAGVGTVLQESIAMMYRDGGDRWLTEDWPVDHFPVASGVHAAEANSARFTESGGRGVVLRFAMFYGNGAAHSEQFVALARHHLGYRAGCPDAFQSSIHLRDAATAVVAALGAPAGVYNVGDDEPMSKRAYTGAVARAVGATPWATGPGRAALLLGDRTATLTRSQRVSNRQLKDATGWSPRYPSVREGFAAMASGADQTL